MDLETMQKAQHEMRGLQEALIRCIRDYRYEEDVSNEDLADVLAQAVLFDARWEPTGDKYMSLLEIRIERYLGKHTYDGGPPDLAKNLARYLTR